RRDEVELEPLVAADVGDDDHLVGHRREVDRADPLLGEGELVGPAADRRDRERLRNADEVGDEGDAAAVRCEARAVGAPHVDEAGVVELEPGRGVHGHVFTSAIASTIVAWVSRTRSSTRTFRFTPRRPPFTRMRSWASAVRSMQT